MSTAPESDTVALPTQQGTDHEVSRLRSFDEFNRSLRAFASWLNGIVPGASDLDCVIERNGHILMVEAKHWQGFIPVPWGQHKMLKAFATKADINVWLVGEDLENGVFHVVNYKRAGETRFVKWNGVAHAMWDAELFTEFTKDSLGVLVSQWWDKVDGGTTANKKERSNGKTGKAVN